MLIRYKDVIRFAVPGNPPALVEVSVAPVGGEWEAAARFRRGTGAWEPLGRRFRSGAKGLALGKMIRWARGRFTEARPVSQRHALGQ